MIRQAISCDICGAEKKQTNHWFVAYAHGGELRVMGWTANNRMRTGSKHLCGQTCLHKLVDEFIAGTMSARFPPEAAERIDLVAATDTSLTSKAAYATSALPASLPVALPAAFPLRSLQVTPAAIIAIARAADEPGAALAAAPFDDAPSYPSPRRRAEAWERERERERRAATHRKTS